MAVDTSHFTDVEIRDLQAALADHLRVIQGSIEQSHSYQIGLVTNQAALAQMGPEAIQSGNQAIGKFIDEKQAAAERIQLLTAKLIMLRDGRDVDSFLKGD
jgi:hypothetical protein